VPFTAVYDACVLYPSTLRDLLIRIAQTGLVQARWTNEILDEVFASLVRQRPDLDPKKLARTRELMSGAIRDALIVNYQDLVPVLHLPDAKDKARAGGSDPSQGTADSHAQSPGLPRRPLDAVGRPRSQSRRLRARADRPR